MSSRFPESSVLKRIFIESIHDCMVWDEIKDLSVPELLEELNDKKTPDLLGNFKAELAKACLEDYVSLEEYNTWCEDIFQTQEGLNSFFVEIWHDLFGDEPITIP